MEIASLKIKHWIPSNVEGRVLGKDRRFHVPAHRLKGEGKGLVAGGQNLRGQKRRVF